MKWKISDELILSGLSGLLLVSGFLFEKFTDIQFSLLIVIYSLSYITGAWDLVEHAYKAVRDGKYKPDIDLLMLVAAIGAAILGEWAEGALLLFLFSAAHALEHYAMDKARNAIKALGELAPQKAKVKRDGKEIEIPIEEVQKDEIVLILPAERISVDGIVKSGNSSVNQAPITGESVPVDKKEGDEVFAGTINGDGALEIITTRASGDRTLDRIIKLVEEAQTQKAPTEEFTDRFESVFVPIVLVSACLVVSIPTILGIWTLSDSFYRAMALLVGASPCALALGTPSAVIAGIAQAARNGVLIKGGAYLENLGSVNAIAFDKTGTLTIGQPEVADIKPFQGTEEAELLRISAAVEKKSQHPLAKAVVNKANELSVSVPEAGDLKSHTAKGVSSDVEGQKVEIGSLKLWENAVIPEDLKNIVNNLQSNGRSIIVTKYGNRWLGALGVRDKPRPSAKAVIERLRILGIKSLIMLTGDNKGIGEAVGREVGVDEVKADLLPEDKVTFIKELLAEHSKVAMVGDGVNDAPALAHATVGISMGAAGTAVALETSDVALMGDDLAKLPFAVGLSRAAKSVIKQNLYISLSVIGFLCISTVSGLFGIGLAVIVHEGSTLVVIMNSLKLLTYKET